MLKVIQLFKTVIFIQTFHTKKIRECIDNVMEISFPPYERLKSYLFYIYSHVEMPKKKKSRNTTKFNKRELLISKM